MESIGRLAGGVAHDFNNMLQAIIGYTSMAVKDLPDGDGRRDDLKHALAAANKAVGLTRQLLAFGRRQVLDMRDQNLNDVVSGVLKMLLRLIGEDIDLIFTPGADPLDARLDAGQIGQVLMNLCVNARDAMPQGGSIRIETARVAPDEPVVRRHRRAWPAPYASLTVSDTGCGIPQDVVDRIFDPFFTTKEVGRGTGLGLAVVHGIVEQHGGWIEVESQAGRGTTFRILLPLSESASQAETERGHLAPVPGGGETVLVAEDDENLRRLVERFLTGAGYRVLLAADGLEAVGRFEEHRERIALLLLDVVMPRVSGIEAARRIRALAPDVPMLFASGYSDETLLERGWAGRPAELIRKPFDPDDLLRRVRSLLDRAREE